MGEGEISMFTVKYATKDGPYHYTPELVSNESASIVLDCYKKHYFHASIVLTTTAVNDLSQRKLNLKRDLKYGRR